MLRLLAPGFPGDEPWCLVVKDPPSPAFMQCPVTDGLGSYKRSRTTPDDLDLLVTSKNHDLKSATGRESQAEDWLFALISLQTMAGFLGAGNYGIRQNEPRLLLPWRGTSRPASCKAATTSARFRTVPCSTRWSR